MRQTTPDIFVSAHDDTPAPGTARGFAPSASPAIAPNAGQHNDRSLFGIDPRAYPGRSRSPVHSLARLSTASRHPASSDGLPGSRLLMLFIALTLAGWTLASFSLGSNDWHARQLPVAAGRQATTPVVTAS